MIVLARWLCLACVMALQPRADGAATNTVQFTAPAPYSSNEELARRFGTSLFVRDYDLSQETFRLVIPSSYTTNSTWGLLVWLGGGDDVVLPSDWEAELARQRIIFVAPLRCGHDRYPVDRLRLALDATFNVYRIYRIDRRRMHIGGFSSGACLASTIGVGAGDLFTGTLCIAGVNYYRHLQGYDGQVYPSAFYPNADTLLYSRLNGRFVFVTSEDDPNREVMKATVERGFRRDGFKHLLELEASGLQQGLPSANTLTAALEFLGKTTNAPPAR
jgi:predicted peptidase